MGFDILARSPGNSNRHPPSPGGLLKAWRNGLLSLDEADMPEMFWQMVEEGIRSLREVALLEWTYNISLKDPQRMMYHGRLHGHTVH